MAYCYLFKRVLDFLGAVIFFVPCVRAVSIHCDLVVLGENNRHRGS